MTVWVMAGGSGVRGGGRRDYNKWMEGDLRGEHIMHR